MAKGGFYGDDGQVGTPIWKESEKQGPIGNPWRTLGGGAASFGIFAPLVGSDLHQLPPPASGSLFW